MSQSEAQRRVVDALGEGAGAVGYEGQVKAQSRSGSTMVPLSPSKCEMDEIESGATMVRGYHTPTSTHLLVRKDDVDPDSEHWAADFV